MKNIGEFDDAWASAIKGFNRAYFILINQWDDEHWSSKIKDTAQSNYKAAISASVGGNLWPNYFEPRIKSLE